MDANQRTWLWGLLAVALSALGPAAAAAPGPVRTVTLARDYYTSGEAILSTLAPVSRATRDSIVKLNVDDETVTLGTVVGPDGLVLTKASELRPGKLTCWLASERKVDAEVLATDAEEDLALVRVQAPALKPIQWAAAEVFVGQWAVTPGIAPTPQAVGIISALPRRIRPPRAMIGVTFESGTMVPRIGEVREGLGADRAGMKPGDLILAINDLVVTNRQQVSEMLREFAAGQTVRLRFQRGDQRNEVKVELMPPPTEELRNLFAPPPSAGRMQGEVSQRAQGFEQAIEHDTVLPPWLCGGPLVNLEGKAIGLDIARAGRVTTYALPPTLVRRVQARLEAAAAKGPAKPPAKPVSGQAPSGE